MLDEPNEGDLTSIITTEHFTLHTARRRDKPGKRPGDSARGHRFVLSVVVQYRHAMRAWRLLNRTSAPRVDQ
jgi:hypothetical protein